MGWVLSEILSLNNETVHDWESSFDVNNNEIVEVMENVKYWADMFLDNDISDRTRHCCYDLILLFTLEQLDLGILPLVEIVSKNAEIICSLLTCNNYTKSEISLKEWDNIKEEDDDV